MKALPSRTKNKTKLMTKNYNGKFFPGLVNTSRGLESSREKELQIMRDELEFKTWTRQEIKARYTPEYIADLLKRAEPQRQKKGRVLDLMPAYFVRREE